MMPLGSIPDWLLNSIIGFDEGANFQDQQLQEMRTQHLQQLHDNRSINQGPSSSTNCGIPPSVDYSNLLAAEVEKQRQELDWILQMENQRLRMIVQEKCRQHAAIFRKYESRIMELISKKDKDLELARSRSMELQNFMMKAQEDNQALKKKAMESEAMVLDLNSKLEQMRGGNFQATFNETGEMESYCESSNRARREEEQEAGEQLKKMGGSSTSCGCCKQCKERRLMNVVFLPCKHLCCCTTCEPLLPLCPVCKSVKGGSLEVFFD